MQAISPLWWARVLGILALFVVVAVRYNEGVPPLSLLEQAVWSMLLASTLGFVLGTVLQGVVSAIEPSDGMVSNVQIDAEMPGTMPPLS